MNRVHNYQGLESYRKSTITEPQSTNHRLTFGKTSHKQSHPRLRKASQFISQIYNVIMKCISWNDQQGLLPLEEKLLLLHQFEELHNSMIDNLNNILTQILQINFDQEGFQEMYHTDPEYLSETLFRDLKYLEQKHSELVYESSLKYLSNLFDCFGLDYVIDIYKLNIHDWADKGLEHIQKFRSLKRQFRSQSRFGKYCKCLFQLFKK